MKILFIAENLTYGGAPRRFIDLANAMAVRGIDTTLFVFNGSILTKDKVSNSVKCIEKQEIKKSSSWLYRNIGYRRKCIQAIDNFLEKNKYDIILSFNDMVNISVLLSKHARQSSVVVSERSDPYYNKCYLQIAKKVLFNGARGIVFQTEGAQNFFGKKIKNKSTVIPNPIPSNVRFDKYEGKREKVIVAVARLWLYQKRQDVLIHAFNSITTKYPDYKLILYGDGPDESAIRKLITELGLETKVILAGVTNDVFQSINKASLFVLSSDFEGIPNSLIEAMGMGLPVISTDCSPGGARLLIKNQVNGLLVPCSDINELAKAMLYILDNPCESVKMGDHATSIVDRFNEDSIYDLWEKYFNLLVR